MANLVLMLATVGCTYPGGYTNENLLALDATSTLKGEIRVSGSPADEALIEELQTTFNSLHPAVQFANRLHGPESTVAAVYADVADIAFMARELREPLERMAFQWVKLERPYEIVIANAGFNPTRPSNQLAIFVHADNPVKELSTAELDSIFGAEHKQGTQNIRNWGELGLPGEWQSRTIHPLGPGLVSIPMLFFRRSVMQNSHKWSPNYKEFENPGAALEALRNDPAAICIAPLALGQPGLRPLALSTGVDGQNVPLTRNSVIDGSYPLNRTISIVMYRVEGEPIQSPLAEFLQFVLSSEGQAIIDLEGSYLPLSDRDIQRQLAQIQ